MRISEWAAAPVCGMIYLTMAQAKSTKSSQPLVVLDIRNSPEISRYIQRESSRLGWRLFNLETSYGLVPGGITPTGALTDRGAKDPLTVYLRQNKVPLVRVGRLPSFYGLGMPAVLPDLNDCAILAAKYFAERGYGTTAFIGRTPWGESESMYLGFSGATQSLGNKCHLLQLENASLMGSHEADRAARWRKRAEAVGAWIASLPGPVGLFAPADKLAGRFCSYCLESGLRVPEDVAILGVGNQQFFCESAPVPLSSVDLEWGTVIHEAADLLQGLMEGQATPLSPRLIPPNRVVERASTAAFGVSDPLVREVIRYLWDHLGENIRTNDLAARFAICRTSLERRFKDGVGRGINAELRRKRLEVAETLLKETDLPVFAIAQQVGFNSMSYFHRFFAKAHPCTPARYRKDYLATQGQA